ncbi:MAG: hypothetical protein R3C49_06685 [Planctomycetaceae bacterium]
MQRSPDSGTVDLTRTRIRLRAGLTFRPQLYGEDVYYHMEVPSRSEFFRIGYGIRLCVAADGRTSFSEALALTARAQGAAAFTQTQALALYQWLLDQDLAEFSDDADAPEHEAAPRPRQHWLQKLNPFWVRVPLGRPDTRAAESVFRMAAVTAGHAARRRADGRGRYSAV